MIEKEILDALNAEKDTAYAAFQKKLIPDTVYDIIGVRTPALKKLASCFSKHSEVNDFLDMLPHGSFEENQLHAFIISLEKDPDICLKEVNRFLPYVDNWATCDQLVPKCFGKAREKLIGPIDKWLDSGEVYTVRFAVGMLMRFFLDGGEPLYMSRVALIRSDEYYINMMRAWYFATALAKNKNAALNYIENRSMDPWTHNKTIQKAAESFRISEEDKQYLKTLRI